MSLIELKNLSLDYFCYTAKPSIKKTLLHTLLRISQSKSEQLQFHQALDNLTLSIKDGDRLALLGKNGAGKSTLLKVISRIFQPTAGSLKIEGNVSSILDIGVGLNHDATGYENIILVGILHGKIKAYMRSKFKEIEEFTELQNYLNMPVRTYSSGMRLRLAFAIATSMESDILIIDEVIGVGDQKFMEKAQLRMKNLVHQCNILVLASHSPQIVETFCNKVLILEHGKKAFFGDVQEGLNLYRT